MSVNPAEVAHGPMLIGTFLNLILYGVCIVQIYLYHNNHRRDNVWVQTFIYGLFLADTLHSVFSMVYMYRCLISNFGNPMALAKADWIAATDPALTGIIGGAVQIFYVRRLKILTRNWIIVTPVLICACSSLLMGVGTAAAVHWIPEYIEFQKFKAVTIIWLLSAALGDVLITLSLVRYLRHQRTGMEKTNSYIDKLVRLTVQTGLLTATWAIVDLVLYLAIPTGLHLIFNFSLSKLYSNSLMSSLNARDFWRYDSKTGESKMHENISGLSELSGLTDTTVRSSKALETGTQLSTFGRGRNTEVFVHVEQSQDSPDPSKVVLEEHEDNEGHRDVYSLETKARTLTRGRDTP